MGYIVPTLFNILIVCAVIGFVIFQRRSLGDMLPLWRLVLPLALLIALQVERILPDNSVLGGLVVHHLTLLLMVLSLLLVAWSVSPTLRNPGRNRA